MLELLDAGALPMAPMKCCSPQEVRVQDANGNFLGATIEDVDNCVPRFLIDDENDILQYILSQPTCWGGMFVNNFAEG